MEILATAKGIELVKSFYKVDRGPPGGQVRRHPGPGGRPGPGLRGGAQRPLAGDHGHLRRRRRGTLFSCDAFGGYGKLGDRIFDDQFYAEEEHAFFEEETLRYYANIVASFGVFVKQAIQKLAGLDIKVDRPQPRDGLAQGSQAHRGPLRRSTRATWTAGREKEICVVWGSMYGNTKKGLDERPAGARGRGRALHPAPRAQRGSPPSSWRTPTRARGSSSRCPPTSTGCSRPWPTSSSLLERKHVKGPDGPADRELGLGRGREKGIRRADRPPEMRTAWNPWNGPGGAGPETT
ncbi:MAG: hypothetical protein M0C28_48515 [Candidatus Moduliflexus flocculans]|nr:hypothetical protein [Candidatus Moduliflexus flocculans]